MAASYKQWISLVIVCMLLRCWFCHLYNLQKRLSSVLFASHGKACLATVAHVNSISIVLLLKDNCTQTPTTKQEEMSTKFVSSHARVFNFVIKRLDCPVWLDVEISISHTCVFPPRGTWWIVWTYLLHGPLAGCACAGMPGTFSPSMRVSDPHIHHGTFVTNVPWCMPGSLTSGFLWSRWWGKRSRHSHCMRNPQFCVSGKRPM